MALSDVRTQAQFLLGSTDADLYRDANGTIQLRPDNQFPNPHAIEEGTDDEPARWDISGAPEKIVAYHYLVSRPGTPRRSTLQRQNTAPISVADASWTSQQAWLPGGRQEADVSVKPQAPEVEAVASTTKGWRAGTYGLAEGRSSEFGPTTTTGIRSFTLAAGEYPILKVPDAFSVGTKTWDIYVTREGGTVPFLQRRVPVERLEPGGEYKLYGPWRNRGRAPGINRSGIGLPPRPRINRDYRLVPSRFDMLAGVWRPGVQIKNDRGYSVLSQLGRGLKVDADLVRKKVAGPAPANAQASAQASAQATLGPGPIEQADPRSIRPSGKRGEHEYIGAEIDWRESEYVASTNNDRRQAGKDPLILTQALNRAAYRKALGDEASVEDLASEEGYPGNVSRVPPAQALARKWLSVGIAIEGEETVLIVGDYLEDDGITELYCEHYDAEGNRHVETMSEDDARAMVDLGWTLVSGSQMHYSYSGSYGSAVSTAAGRWHALGVISVQSGGTIQCAITDGSPNAGAIATTYSDGRMVLSSYYMSRATTNARNAALAHEFGHTLGFGHPSGVASVLNTPIIIDGTSNYETPTSYDVSEYRRVYGTATGGDGADNPDPNQTEWRNPQTEGEPPEGGTSEPPPPDPPEFHYEWVPGTVKKNTALFLRVPRVVLKNGGRGPGGLKYTYFLEHESTAGVIKRYRVVYRHSRQGLSMYFDDVGQFKRGIEVSAYAPDTEPRGLRVGLVEEEFPTEDSTVLEAPDPTSVPDAPPFDGAEQLPAGAYLCAVQGVYESGALTRVSEPAEITITGTQMIKVSPVMTVNALKNAEFSLLDATGKPEDWTPVNIGSPVTNTYSVSGGVLTLNSASSTASPPRLDGNLYRVDPEQPFTVAGSLGVSRYVTGIARVALRQYDENRALITDLFPGGVNSQLTSTASEVTFQETYGPGYTALDPNTVYVALSPRQSGTVNMTASYWNLRILPFPSDVRRVEDGSFEASADTPLPSGSYVAAGAPANPAGVAVSEPAPPLDLLDFESGALPAAWTQNGTSANQGVTADAAIFGAYGYRVQDASSTAAGTGWLDRTFGAIAGTKFALRGLYRIDQLPTVGYIRFHLIGVGTDSIFFYLGTNGSLRVSINGTLYPLTAVSAGSTIDVELLYVGTKNGTLSVGLGVNGARRSIVYTGNFDFSGRLINRAAPGVFYASDPRGRYNLAMDQVVITEGGDILDRESPPAPSGYTPPLLDRPLRDAPAWTGMSVRTSGELVRGTAYPASRTAFSATTAGKSGPFEPAWDTTTAATTRDNQSLAAVARSEAYAAGAGVLKPGGTSADAEWYECTTVGTTDATAPTYPTTDGATVTDGTAVFTTRKTVVWAESGAAARQYDIDGETTRQLYAFIQPGDAPIHRPATIPLLEDRLPVRPGVTYGFSVFRRWSVFTVADAPGIRVWLEGEEDSEVEPVLALSMPMGGARGWHPSGQATAQEDDYGTFDVPLTGGYTHARFELLLTDGEYVFDSFLLTQGANPLFADRDAKRDYGRAATATGEFVLDLLPRLADMTIQPGFFVSEAGVKRAPDETPVGDLAASMTTSPDRIAWAPYTGPGSQAYRYVKALVTLTGDGRDGPAIPRGGIYARTWTPVGVLLRPDGSHFPGVAWVGNGLAYEEYPDVDFNRVGGRVQRVVRSESIGRIKDMPIRVATEAARREIAALAGEPDAVFVVDIPHAGGRVGGESYRVVFGSRPEFDFAGVSMVWDGERLHDAAATVAEVEVLEHAPQQSPMLPAISTAAIEIATS